jgi:hypothetical protein
MRAKLAVYTLSDLINESKEWNRHPRNKNTVTTGEQLLEKIIQGLPSFDIHVDKKQIIQNHDVLLFVVEALVTATPYAFNPVLGLVDSSQSSIPLEVIYNNRKLFMYCKEYPEYLDLLRNVHDNLHKALIPCYFLDYLSKESIEVYLERQ